MSLSLPSQNEKAGHVAQLDRASDYESEGLGFDSLRDHQKALRSILRAFFYTGYIKGYAAS